MVKALIKANKKAKNKKGVQTYSYLINLNKKILKELNIAPESIINNPIQIEILEKSKYKELKEPNKDLENQLKTETTDLKEKNELLKTQIKEEIAKTTELKNTIKEKTHRIEYLELNTKTLAETKSKLNKTRETKNILEKRNNQLNIKIAELTGKIESYEKTKVDIDDIVKTHNEFILELNKQHNDQVKAQDSKLSNYYDISMILNFIIERLEAINDIKKKSLSEINDLSVWKMIKKEHIKLIAMHHEKEIDKQKELENLNKQLNDLKATQKKLENKNSPIIEYIMKK
ncbi:MAG: hypothetical protein FWH29_04305 [Methanobrevibacter sp.]|nr:hypothetical protein [Methanobrevibacter sp.]